MAKDIVVKNHDALKKVPQESFAEVGREIMAEADKGVQTAIVDKANRVRSIIGMNGMRYLPTPSVDPLEDLFEEVFKVKGANS